MNNLIEQRISNVFQWKETFFQHGNQSSEQAKTLMIETLQTIVLLIQELINHFRAISTQSCSKDLQLISEKCTELEKKSGQLNKLTNWYVNEEGKEKDGNKRTIEFDRVESILISARTVIINARSKTDYSGQMMLVEYELSKKSNQTYLMAFVIETKKLYRNYIIPFSNHPLIKEKLWTLFRPERNKKSDPPLTEITTKPQLQKSISSQVPVVNSFVMIDSVEQIQHDLNRMNHLTDQYKPLAGIVDGVKKWFDEN